jgi:hypothetical protein
VILAPQSPYFFAHEEFAHHSRIAKGLNPICRISGADGLRSATDERVDGKLRKVA